MASQVVTSLIATIRARTSGFQKGMRGAGKTLDRFSNKLGFIKSKALGFGAALGGLAAGGGLAVLTKQSFDAIDALAKTSAKLGIATGDLAALQHAAQLTGNSTRNLNLGLQRMTRRVAEAAAGTGEAKNALAELGLDAVKLNQMSPDKQFSAIADAMNKVGAQSDKVRLGFKLFDAEGVGLINTLAGGSAELEKLTGEAKRFGIAVSAIDARKIEAANDSVLRMRQAFRGLINRIAVRLAPTLSAIAEKIADWASSTAVVEGLMSVVNTAINFALKLTDGLIFDWKAFRKSINEAYLGMLEIGRWLHRHGVPGFGSDLAGAINKTRTQVNLLGHDLEKFLAGGNLTDTVNRLTKELERSLSKRRKPIPIPVMPQVKAGADVSGGLPRSTVTQTLRDIGSALVVNPNLINIGNRKGTAFEQRIRSPQLEETNSVLEEIRNLISRQRGALAA